MAKAPYKTKEEKVYVKSYTLKWNTIQKLEHIQSAFDVPVSMSYLVDFYINEGIKAINRRK